MEEHPSWKSKWFSACQKIPPLYGKQSFITAFTGASHLPLSWAHNSGSIQVWGTRLYFVTRYVFTVRSFSHSTQSLSWSTNPCRLCATAYSMYSQLPSVLEAVPLSATWGSAMLWWQAPIYLGYIAYCDGFTVTNDSEDVLSVCIINTTVTLSSWYVSFLGSSGKSHIMPRTSVGNSVLKALQLSVGLKAMYNSCFQMFGIYTHVKTPDYT